MFGSSSLTVTPSLTFSAHPDPKKADWVVVQTNVKVEENKPITLDSRTIGGMERFLLNPTTSVAGEEKKLTEPHHLIFVLDVSTSMTSASYPNVRIPDLESPTQKRGYEIVYLTEAQDIAEIKIQPDTFYIKVEKDFFSYAVLPPSWDKKPIISEFYAADIGTFRDLDMRMYEHIYDQQESINNKLAIYSAALKQPSLALKLLFEHATKKKYIRAGREYPDPMRSEGYLFIWVPEYIKMSDIVPQKYIVYIQPLPERQAFEFCVLSSHGKQTDIISFANFKKSNSSKKMRSSFEKLLKDGSDDTENTHLIKGFWKVETLSQHLYKLSEPSLTVMQKALIQFIEKSPPQHRYSLIVFSGEGQLLLCDGDQVEMLKALNKIQSSLGTNIYNGLSLITKDMMKSNSTIFLLTDGESFGPGPAEIIQKLKIALDYSTTFPMVIIGYGRHYKHEWLAALEKGSCYPHKHLSHSGELIEFFAQNKPADYLKQYFQTEIMLTLGGSYVHYRENNILPWQGTYAFPVGDILSRDRKREFTYALQVTVNGQSSTLKGRSALPSPKPEIMNQLMVAESQAIFHEEKESRQNQIIQLQKLLRFVHSQDAVFEMLQQILTLYQPLEDNLFDKNENAELIKQASAQLSHATMTGDALMNKSLKRTKNYDPKEHIIILSKIPYLVINSRFDFADQKQKNNLACVPPGMTSRNVITVPFAFIEELKKHPNLTALFEKFKNKVGIKLDKDLFKMLCRQIHTFDSTLSERKLKVDNEPVPLEDYFKNYRSVRASLPQALLMALLIGELVKSQHLVPGKVHFIERMTYNFNRLDFVIYETDKQLFYIDPVNHLFFDLKNEEHLYQLFDMQNRIYPGLLEGLARRYGLNIPIKLEKINPDGYDIFSSIYAGTVPPELCCAKTLKLMQNPVLLVQNEDYCCFEAKFLYAHLRQYQTHPLTGKKIELKHLEIYPAYTKTKQIWDWMQEKITRIKESIIADRLRLQLDKTVSEMGLENYFQVKFFYDPFKKRLGLSFPFKEQAAYFMALLSKQGPILGITLDQDHLSTILFTPVLPEKQSAYFDFKSHSALLLFLKLLNLKPLKAFIKTKTHQDQSFSLVCHCYLSPEIYTLDAPSASVEGPKNEKRDFFYQRTKLFFATDDKDFNLGKYRFYIPSLQGISAFPKEYRRSLQTKAPKPQAPSVTTSSFLKEKKPDSRYKETKVSEDRLSKHMAS